MLKVGDRVRRVRMYQVTCLCNDRPLECNTVKRCRLRGCAGPHLYVAEVRRDRACASGRMIHIANKAGRPIGWGDEGFFEVVR